MRQAVVVASDEIRLLEVEPPRLGPGEVLVAPRFVGICGTDLHVLGGHHGGVELPIAIGHECTGVVAGPNGVGLVPGTPVAVVPLFACEECPHCRRGDRHICVRREVLGLQRPGCLADLVSVPAANLLPLEPDQDPELAALFEPLAVAIHAAALAEARSGDRAVVVGAGSIGLLVALYLREEIGAQVSIVEISPDRVAFARSLGFEAVAGTPDLRPELVGDRPLAFDCVGRAASVRAILDLVPAPRAAVLVGSYESSETISLPLLRRHETRVVGCLLYTMADLRRAIAILASPGGERYRPLLVAGDFTLDRIEDVIRAARTATVGTKVVVRIAG
jgi:(R,R)-butanediol dehydrogenase / meso-butanediol dehydrogenase / diacetyl reductase